MTDVIRLVAIDVDGTLTDAADRVSEANVQAIRAVAAAGVRVVLATGRAPHGCDEVLQRLGIPVGLVSVNGAVVYEWFGSAPMMSRLLPPETCREVVETIVEAGLAALVWDDPERSDGIVHERPGTCWPGFLQGQMQRVHAVPALAGWLDHPALTVVAWGTELAMRSLQAMLLDRLGERGAVEVGLYPPDPCWVLTVTAAGCDKSVGLAEYAAKLGVTAAQVMAIGDSSNDVGMLRWAGLAVAMGNAAPAVKALADLVVADHDHDGVAEALRRCVPAATEAV